MQMRTVTVAYGPHRVEMLELMEKRMKEHRVVILEEPEHPDFYRMLKRKASIRRYLASGVYGFPRFILRAYRIYQEMCSRTNLSFYQVDPYMAVAKLLMQGKEAQTELEQRIWKCEHYVAGALLRYYEATAAGSFEALVEATKLFARADAYRNITRERMRAEGIADVVNNTEGDVYIEAGYIHLTLYLLLRKILRPPVKLRRLFLLREPIHGLSNLPWRQHLSPGDTLTLRYAFGKPARPSDNLLAAQNLVYVSLVSKEEKLPTPTVPFPHLTEELYLCRFVRRLTYRECHEFYVAGGQPRMDADYVKRLPDSRKP